MAVWIRRFVCAVCKRSVYYDDVKHVLSCGCGDCEAYLGKGLLLVKYLQFVDVGAGGCQ